MFSFTTNTTIITTMSPFPQLYFPSSPPNYHLPQPPLSPQDDVFFHHSHRYDPSLLLANDTPETPIDFRGAGTSTVVTAGSSPVKKPAAKKDRHSKIYTAQGLRDRRVRLPIDIAREFFDLQDMLGFDKASKTLEWLLRKSRNDIHELSRAKRPSGSKSFSPTSLVIDQGTVSEVIKEAVFLTEGFGQTLEQTVSSNKELREKARARARARTKEKWDECEKKIEKWQFMTSTIPDNGSDRIANPRDHCDVVMIKRNHHQKLKFPRISSSASNDYPNQRTKTVGYASDNNVVVPSLLPHSWDNNDESEHHHEIWDN